MRQVWMIEGENYMKVNTRKLCVLAMMSALAFLLAAYVRISIVPAVGFLRYDPKDIIIVIAGFIFGPLAAFVVTVVVAAMQWFTGVSTTAHIGFFMNVVSGTAFCCTAALIYKKKRTFKGALIGLIIAGLFATAVMMLWNYILTPIFMEQPRERIVRLLLPGFLPFNLINNGINIVLTMLLYKRIKGMLHSTGMMQQPDETGGSKMPHAGLILSVLFALLTIALWVLILVGII